VENLNTEKTIFPVIDVARVRGWFDTGVGSH